jgi:4-hydroxy-tetrahydrodipicolinate reductase
MIRIAICGIAGRMCGRVAHLAVEADDMEIVGGVEPPRHETIGQDVGDVIGTLRLGVHVVDDLEHTVGSADAVVIFTTPPAPSVDIAALAAEADKPIVIGTTGLDADQVARLKDSVKNVACVFAPSFSVGVTVLIKLVEEAARVMGDAYDVEIVEAHHHFKEDAPSGTALAMAQAAAAGLDRNLDEVGIYGRKGDVGARTKQEIGIHAVRAGDLTGEHTVYFGGIGETIQLVHRSHSRDSFATGAIRAVRFVVDAQPGFYTMRDVLGID